MKKTYVAPELFVEEFVADTMIASGGGGSGASAFGNNEYEDSDGTYSGYWPCYNCGVNDSYGSDSAPICFDTGSGSC